MKQAKLFAAALLLSSLALPAVADDAPAKDKDKPDAAKIESFKPESRTSEGSVNVGGRHIDYQAVAGTLVVHAKGWDDVPQNADKDAKEGPAEASMFYVAYFKKGAKASERPVTFIFNGGPGSSSVWLHMGAFGPRRVVTADDSHSDAAPYPLINNDYSLLDASDLVFIDAPGTGFSRIAGKDHEKAFWGVDPDAHAFASFITGFIGQYGRWNSPKYLFGESYGTTRSANVANLLETDCSVDLNGVILLSQILAFDASADAPQFNPGVDLPYQLALPTYAATAWYHHKLPNQPAELVPFLTEVEHFAMGDYAVALAAGSTLDPAQEKAAAEKLHQYTGLPVEYIEKADLRINGGKFEQNLQGDNGTVTGRLDTRFSGPAYDPLSEESEYDPQSAAISSAYVSVFNDYVRKDLKYGEGKEFKPVIDIWKTWNFLHQAPGAPIALPQATNVMPDLAMAMKYNPKLKVLLNAGYYDLATPFYEGVYEMQHLPIPQNLQGNIQFRFYESGHMVYAHEAALKQLHDNVAGFIRSTDNVKDGGRAE
ncbi:S10 family peptidase [Nevskia soli]|uniref:S10 family peptidase n=1 Tax=Nevskia soli TaxID=418856 RepID=UPI0004A6F1E9|nr:peptidase S10 [Nevskia soli]